MIELSPAARIGLVRVLIVDDEPPARRRLRRLIAARSDVELVGESTNGREAVLAIRELEPDVVFLDIRMPDLDGFGVVEEVGPTQMPVVVFVTAYDQYAIDAFEAQALDYLLKPFSDQRFERALVQSLQRLREMRSDDLCAQLTTLIESQHQRKGPSKANSRSGDQAPGLRRLAVHKSDRVVFVQVDEIEWIEAQGAYVKLHLGGQAHLVRDSLKRLEQELDSNRFLRIHRSTIVNIDCVVEMSPLFHGEFELVLRSGARTKLSRSYRHQVARLKGEAAGDASSARKRPE